MGEVMKLLRLLLLLVARRRQGERARRRPGRMGLLLCLVCVQVGGEHNLEGGRLGRLAEGCAVGRSESGEEACARRRVGEEVDG